MIDSPAKTPYAIKAFEFEMAPANSFVRRLQKINQSEESSVNLQDAYLHINKQLRILLFTPQATEL